MKYEKLIYGTASILVIILALLKIFHLPYSNYSNPVLILVFSLMFFYQAWHVGQLKKRIKELEGK